MAVTPSTSYSLTVRLEITNRPGMLGHVASAIGDAGGDIGAVDLVESTRDRVQRDITIKARDSAHGQEIPSVFNKSVAPAVADGVARAAHETGTARRSRRQDPSTVR